MDPFDLAESFMDFIEHSTEYLVKETKPRRILPTRKVAQTPAPLPPKATHATKPLPWQPSVKKEPVAVKVLDPKPPVTLQRTKSFDSQDRLHFHPMFGPNYNPRVHQQQQINQHQDFAKESYQMKFTTTNDPYVNYDNRDLRRQMAYSQMDFNPNQVQSNNHAAISSICRVCKREPISIRFLPCKHQICCVDCALRTNQCKQCQSRIDERLTLKGASLSSEEDDLVGLRKKVRSLEDARICSICMERTKDTVFGCGHLACGKCSRSLTTCHICRKNIEVRTKMFNDWFLFLPVTLFQPWANHD